MLSRLHQVTMAVPDLAPCIDFYGGVLRLPDSGGGVDDLRHPFGMYRIGPADLILLEDSSAVPYAQLAGMVRTEVDHFALYVDDVDMAFEVLQGRGVSFRDEPHTTELGHRNMQRSLVSFEDPFGFTLQLSQAVDPRPGLAPRIEAKQAMAGEAAGAGEIAMAGEIAGANGFGGIDHVSTYCSDFKANRTLYRDILGFDEFFYSTSREEGAEVGTGFEQGAFAAGGTDIELASDDEWQHLVPGPVRGLGFQVGQIERVRGSLQAHGISFEDQPLYGAPDLTGRSSLAFDSPDGMRLQIVE